MTRLLLRQEIKACVYLRVRKPMNVSGDETYVAHSTSGSTSLDRIRTRLRILASTPRYLDNRQSTNDTLDF